MTPAPKNGPSVGRGRLSNLNKAPPAGALPVEEKPIAGKMTKAAAAAMASYADSESAAAVTNKPPAAAVCFYLY